MIYEGKTISFLRNVFHYSSFTLISRITGQIRTTLLASLWGVSAYGDIFFLAFRIPNLLRRFFAEGAMSSAFIPLFSKMNSAKEVEGDELSKEEFFTTIFWLLGGAVLVVVIFGISLSETISTFLFILQEQTPNILDKIEETSLLLKILFPYIGFVSLCSLQQGVLENQGKFTYSASIPVFFNLTVITVTVGILLRGDGISFIENLLKNMGIIDNKELAQTVLVSLGVILGGMGQLGYAYSGVRRLGYRIFPSKKRGRAINFSHPSVRKFLLLLLPVFLSSGSHQIQILLTEPITLSLGEGSVSILYYANRLLEFPLGIFGIAITTAALPLLSKTAQDPKDQEKFISLIHYAINTIYILFFPILIVCFFYSQTIVSIVFEFNQFTRQNTVDTALTFLVLIPALFSLAGYRILFNVFYAKENTHIPLFISSINLFLGVPLAYLLTRYYPHPIMIALSTTVSSYIMLAVSLYLLHLKSGISLFKFLGEKTLFFIKVGLIIVPMGYIVYRLIDPVFRILEKSTDHFITVKLIYLTELGFFSLWIFSTTLAVLILFREPQVIRLLPPLKNKKPMDD